MHAKSFDVVIVGAGAAGLMCAATAGQRGRRVLVLDHSDKLAEKIRISGGGRCNFTNRNIHPERYLSANPHFVRSALAQYSQWDFIKLVERHGIAYHEKTLGQLFCDDSAQQIIDMLDAECADGGVRRQLGCTVHSVSRSDDGRFVLATSHGEFDAESLVVATGGLSIPAIGATPWGYRLAEQFGLAITPLKPGLVPLTFDAAEQHAFGPLAGLSLDMAASLGKASFREQGLFTHKGVSGPVILQISSYWQPGQTIELDLLPGANAHELLSQAAHSEQKLSNVLAQAWPKRFAVQWLAAQDAADAPMRQLNPKTLSALAEQIHAWLIRPSGTQGYKKAEVTVGGVDTRELSSKTLMANKVPGLFFVGEVVDVTGWLGGYNFQWAWSSGYVVGGRC